MSHLRESSKSDLDEKNEDVHIEETHLEIDLTKYHEQRAGRLVLDPKCVCYISFFLYAFLIRGYPRNSEARVEFGDTVASRLKLSLDGNFILWPQPTDDPEDPQNVCLCPKRVR